MQRGNRHVYILKANPHGSSHGSLVFNIGTASAVVSGNPATTNPTIDTTNHGIDWSLLYGSTAPSSNSVQSAPGLATVPAGESRLAIYNRMTAEGWILKELYISDQSSSQGIRTNSITANAANVVVDTRGIKYTFAQPTKSVKKYGNQILQFASQANSVIMTVIGINKYSWIPSAFGIDLNTIAAFIARGHTVTDESSSLTFYDCEVKLKGSTNYIMRARAQAFMIYGSQKVVNYHTDGSPLPHVLKQKSYFVYSPHYNDYPFLRQMAIQYGEQSAGLTYVETYKDQAFEFEFL